jgi:hypothetical protein
MSTSSMRSLNYTSYMTLTCILYRSFMGIWAIIISISLTSYSGVCVVSGSSLIISLMTLNVSLLWVKNCTVSSSCFCAGGLRTSFCCCAVASDSSWHHSCCIFSWNYIIFSMICYLYASIVLTASSLLSWTLSMTRPTTSQVRLMSRSSMSFFLFLCAYVPCVTSFSNCEGFSPLVCKCVESTQNRSS